MTSNASSAIHQNVIPSEVGWQFVPQYYTFVNKEPNRLHCFYTKSSTFSHGTEGEDVQPCFGQQEIHNKITSIGFKDCKVFIHSVDAQSSSDGGIIIQVIGEMSNAGGDWRKFVQTFFLAEQPNGYFVLNDIFRFLKEETVEEDVVEEGEASTSVPEPAPEAEAAVVQPSFTAAAEAAPVVEAPQTPPREPTPPPAVAAAEEPVTVAPEPASPSPAPEAKLNGATESTPEPSPAPAEEPPAPAEPEPAPVPVTAPSSTPSPAPSSSAPPPAATPAPAAAPAPSPAPVQTTPKTWASLAATNLKKWGPQVAQESRGMSEAVPATSSSPGPSSGAQTPTRGAAPQRGGHQGQQRDLSGAAAVQNLTTPQCFIKGVVDPVTPQLLTQTLTQRFGPVKDLDIVRSKACAFLEFLSLDAAKRAIQASLPQSQGGEGGVRIDVGGGETVRITVEMRKERGDRPPTRGRGGPPNGEMRGGYRGRGGPSGRGRGGPPAGKQ